MFKIFNLHNFIGALSGDNLIEVITYDDEDKREVLYSGNSYFFEYSDCDNEYGDCDIMTAYISDNKMVIMI